MELTSVVINKGNTPISEAAKVNNIKIFFLTPQHNTLYVCMYVLYIIIFIINTGQAQLH